MARTRPLVAGNWKMNGTKAQLSEVMALKDALKAAASAADVAICPPATLVSGVAAAVTDSAIMVGGQDCHPRPSGAHTGDVSAEMLADAGAGFVIVGHSERRADHGENDAMVRAKAEAAWRAGLAAILCVGESGAERKAGQALAVVEGQLAASVPDAANSDNLVIAYEPVWAIGTGLTPTEDDIVAMHRHIRSVLGSRFGTAGEGIGILYGGSVNPGNAATILKLEGVGGALVGGASLKAADFLKIIAAAG